ncbi:alpha-galactosidase [Proteiniphilum sp. UBA5384]|uniref:alpha-galactosidase n=1 Tax=Proteiniphilum sp. UBA5384 TaxID=1947279 RepID=UPI0025FDD046|nr:alpha-galactosidase [Proteiniphilum sp. UBA5384]
MKNYYRSIFLFLLLLPFIVVGANVSEKEGVLINLQTKDLSMIMTVGKDSVVYFHHFGKKIEDATPFLRKKSYRRDDYGTDPHAYLAAGGSNYREPALLVTHSDGDLNTELAYVGHQQEKMGDDNVVQTTITMQDKKLPLVVQLIVTAYTRENVFTQKVNITNRQKQDVVLHNFYSSYLPIRAKKYYLNSFHGAWAQEMFMEESLLNHGIKSIENRMGVRTTHTENPSFVLALDMPLDENAGEVIGGALAWSGNYKINFQVDEFDMLGITAGMNPYASEYTLGANEIFHTPEMVYTYSTTGAGGVSRNLHDWARRYQVYDAGTVRPTLLNSWEGAYFTFDEKTITDMIDDAADMGLEMFVLDDGWFGNKYPRNSSGQGLGDWQVTESKLPRGISYLADYTVNKGLQFGIWIEPEMVNPKSELAERHPDWIVKAKGRPVPTTRNQWLLDMTNPEVQDFVFGVFDDVMKQSDNISYVKWDANRHVASVGSAFLPADKQSHFWINYTQGLYSVYERIRAKYPDVLIQACSSGGGRVDYGAMKYNQEVWTSDNTDARSRIFIQYGTNMIYPALVTGSHVSAVPNHQTGNVTPLKFRFDMAMSGRFGMELQPKDLSGKEKEFAKTAIENYKYIRDIVMEGDLYRIISPYEEKGLYAIMYVDKDKKRAVVFDYCFEYQGRTHRGQSVKLHGLDPAKRYKVTELNVEKSGFWGNNGVFSGEYLINEGINPQLEKMYQSAVFFLESID